MNKNNKQKKGKLKWLLIFSPILVMAIAVGITYGVLQYKLGQKQDDPKKELVNSVIKDTISNPTEIKDVLDSITITDQVQDQSQNDTNAGGTSSSTDNTSSESTTSISDLKDNYEDYDLIGSNAENVGGDNYHLTATIKNKYTGAVKTVEVTTALSESTKNMLKNYR